MKRARWHAASPAIKAKAFGKGQRRVAKARAFQAQKNPLRPFPSPIRLHKLRLCPFSNKLPTEQS
jgi:hypothetical protein